MSRILLLLENKKNGQILADTLSRRHDLLVNAPADGSFDLAMVDPRGLMKSEKYLHERKEAEDPVLLPVILVTSRQTAGVYRPDISEVVDEIILTPVEKVELFARTEMLLRARRLSLELRLRKDDLEAFIQAMTHDLRAPLRTVTGFAEAMAENQSERLDASGRHQLDRIQAGVGEMWELIESLVDFSRLGRKAIRLKRLALDDIVKTCLEQMESDIQSRNAEVVVGSPLGSVEGDAALLKIAVCNLVGNGIKYVAPGVKPCLQVFSTTEGRKTRLNFRDNGIGIRAEDQEKIFTPFVRLHGVEDYPGWGLGLSAERRVVEIMGGRTGVESQPGQGSTFWIELGTGEYE